MIEAELHDGTILEFPDGTSPDVIQGAVRKQLGVPRETPSNPAPGAKKPGAIASALDTIVGVAKGAWEAVKNAYSTPQSPVSAAGPVASALNLAGQALEPAPGSGSVMDTYAPVPTAPSNFRQIAADARAARTGPAIALPPVASPASAPIVTSIPEAFARGAAGGPVRAAAGDAAVAGEIIGDPSGGSWLRKKAADIAGVPKGDGVETAGKIGDVVGTSLAILAGKRAGLGGFGVTGIPLFAMPSYAESKREMLSRGVPEQQATIASLAKAGLEYGTELPVIRAIDNFALSVRKATSGRPLSQLAPQEVTNLVKSAAAVQGWETTTEEASTLGNWLVDRLSKDPSATGERLWKDMKETAQTMLSAGPALIATGGAAGLAGRARQAIAERVAPQRELGRALQEDVEGAGFTPEGISAAARAALSPSRAQIESRGGPTMESTIADFQRANEPVGPPAPSQQEMTTAAMRAWQRRQTEGALPFGGKDVTDPNQVSMTDILRYIRDGGVMPDRQEDERPARSQPVQGVMAERVDLEPDYGSTGPSDSVTRAAWTEDDARERLSRKLPRSENLGEPPNPRTVFEDAKGKMVVGKITPQDWVDRVLTQIPPEELPAARYWYQQLHSILGPIYGRGAGRRALAWLMSQQNESPTGGMRNVLRADDNVKGLATPQPGLNAEALRAVLSGRLPRAGLNAKLLDFMDSEAGHDTRTVMGRDRRGGQPAAFDVWAQRDIGHIDEPTYNRLVERFGQAAVDAKGLKVLSGAGGEVPYEHGVAFYNKMAQHLNRINFDGGGWTAREVQAVGWTAIQKEHGVRPEFVSDIIKGNTRRVSIGLAPGTGSPIPANHPMFQPKNAMRTIKEVARLANVKILMIKPGEGAYLGTGEGAIIVDAFASPEAVRDFSQMVAYVFQQDEVWAHRQLLSGNRSAIDIPFIKGKGKEAEFFQKMREFTADDAGRELTPGYQFLPDGAGIRLLNASGHWGQAKFEHILTAAAFAAQETGVEVAEVLHFNVEIEVAKNDYSQTEEGEWYLGSVRNPRGIREQELERIAREAQGQRGQTQPGQGGDSEAPGARRPSGEGDAARQSVSGVGAARSKPARSIPSPKALAKRSPEFAKWYGKSKIDGVWYHGTSQQNITTFRPKQAGAIYVTQNPEFADDFANMSQEWMAAHGYPADSIGQNVIPLYVKAENPFDFENEEHLEALRPVLTRLQAAAYAERNPLRPGQSRDVWLRHAKEWGADLAERFITEIRDGEWRTIEDSRVQPAIKALGHDGFYVLEGLDKNIGVYKPTQLKSAIGNRGTFSPKDTSILGAGPSYSAAMIPSKDAMALGFRGRDEINGIYQFSSKDKERLARVISHAIELGMPAPIAQSIRSWVLYDKGYSQFYAAYWPNIHVVGISAETWKSAPDDVVAKYIIHELAHNVDNELPPTGGERQEKYSSQLSGRYRVEALDDETIMAHGDLADEIIEGMSHSVEVASHFGYPLNSLLDNEMSPEIAAVELWAQASSLFHTQPDVVKRLMPQNYAVMEAVYGSKDGSIDAPKSIGEARSRLRQALQDDGATLKDGGSGVQADARRGVAPASGASAPTGPPSQGMGRWSRVAQGAGGTARGNAQHRGPSRTGPAASGVTAWNFKPGVVPPGPAGAPPRAQPPQQGWDINEPGLIDNILRNIQNNKLDIHKVQEEIERVMGSRPDADSPRLVEEVFKGKVRTQISRFHANAVKPLLKEIADSQSKVTIDDVGEYLWALHTPERNAQMQKINPGGPDNLAGQTDAEAAAKLRAFSAAGKMQDLRRIGRMVDDITRGTRQMLVAEHLEDQSTIDTWQQTYKNYVPLFRDVDDMPSKGAGFETKGPESRRAMGSQQKPIAILAAVIAQRERAIMRARMAEVGRQMIKLAEDAPNPDFWRVDDPPLRRVINKSTGLVQTQIDPLYKDRKDVFVVKDLVNGKVTERILAFNPNRERAMAVARGLQNLDLVQLHAVNQAVARVTRLMANLATAWNPGFWVTNLARDVQTASVNLQATELRGRAPHVIANIPRAIAGIASAEFKRGTGKWAQLYRDFEEAGGKMGWMSMFGDLVDRQKDLEREIKASQRGALNPKTWARVTGEIVEKTNNAIENATRLAIFAEAKALGLSDLKAASLAKNATVNFDRKGNASSSIGAWYMFFNAQMQGTAIMLASIAKSRKVQAMVGTMAVIGAALEFINRLIGDANRDEDGNNPYELIPEHIRQKNLILIIPTEGGKTKTISIPLPYGFSIFFSAGRVMMEAMLGGSDLVDEKRSPIDLAWDFGQVVLDSFGPLGGSTTPLQYFAPSAMKPVVQQLENKTWYGSPIHPEPQAFGKEKPKSDTFFRSTSDTAKEVARWLNEASGGDDVKGGWADVYPGNLEHAFTSMAGGAGQFGLGVFDFTKHMVGRAAGTAESEDLPARRVPFVGKFYGELDERDRAAKYYRLSKEAKQTLAQWKEYKKLGEMEKADALEEKSPELIEMGKVIVSSRFRADMRRIRDEFTEVDKLPMSERPRARRELRKDEIGIISEALQAYNETVADKRRETR